MTFGKIFLGSMDMNGDGTDDIEADFEGQFHMNFGFDVDRDTLIPNTGFFTFDSSPGTPGFVPHTTIYGFDIANGSSISFNGTYANGFGGSYNYEFIDLNPDTSGNVSLNVPETNANALWDDIRNAFDTAEDNIVGPTDQIDNTFVYRLFDELEAELDLNGDDYLSSRLGVLAYDREKENIGDGGLTALVFLNDLNGTLTADSISEFTVA
jgi:hypothetical protein